MNNESLTKEWKAHDIDIIQRVLMLPSNCKREVTKELLMEQLLSSQLTELRIKSRHRQLLCGRMGYGGEVLLLQ